jgi:sortase (surface protein transpeptidase)
MSRRLARLRRWRAHTWLCCALVCASLGALAGGALTFRPAGAARASAQPAIGSAAGSAASATEASAEGGRPGERRPAPPLGPVPLVLSIPAIGVHTKLDLLRRTSTGTLAAPRDPRRAGWYTASAVPGDVGPAVIAGHLDSRTGPGVFARLGLLRAGDLIRVTRSDGGTAAFRVVTVRRYADAHFPSAQVYGPQPSAALRLITCAGPFDRASLHYLDNVVVFAA